MWMKVAIALEGLNVFSFADVRPCSGEIDGLIAFELLIIKQGSHMCVF